MTAKHEDSCITQMAEDRFGIKADPDDVKKLQSHILGSYGAMNAETLEKVFSSGEAAGLLTVCETYFFREQAHFALLLDLLPSFEKTGVEICCAAVGTGCESYSIAMLIEAYNKSIENPLPYHIDAFDINPKVIESACQGAYGQRALREDGSNFRYMTSPWLRKTTNGFQVDESLKKNIHFFIHNLMDEIKPKQYDLIFFRNAFIYFSQKSRGRILSNLSAVLKGGGLLILGVSETAGADPVDLEQKYQNDVFYFQKPVNTS
jgi:chemotaxis methyl-accepting protein methylase